MSVFRFWQQQDSNPRPGHCHADVVPLRYFDPRAILQVYLMLSPPFDITDTYQYSLKHRECVPLLENSHVQEYSYAHVREISKVCPMRDFIGSFRISHQGASWVTKPYKTYSQI